MKFFSVNSTPKLAHDSIQFNKIKSKWLNDRCTEAVDIPRNVDNVLNRMMDILCQSPKFSESETEILSSLLFSMQQIFTETQVCLPTTLDLCVEMHKIWECTYVKHPDGSFHHIILKQNSMDVDHLYSNDGIDNRFSESFQCFDGEPDLERIMQGDFTKLSNGDCTLKFNEIFRWAWESWRLAVGNKIGNIYPTLVEYMNIGATNNGKCDRNIQRHLLFLKRTVNFKHFDRIQRYWRGVAERSRN